MSLQLQRPALQVSCGVLIAVAALYGCGSDIEKGVPLKKHAAFMRVLNAGSKDASVKIDGLTLGQLSPGTSPPYQAKSPKPHTVSVTGVGTAFNQTVTPASGETLTIVVADGVKPTVLSGEDHTPRKEKATVQVVALPGATATLRISGTELPLATGSTFAAATEFPPGDVQWVSGTTNGTFTLTAEHCVTVVLLPKGKPVFFDYSMPKPVGQGVSGAG